MNVRGNSAIKPSKFMWHIRVLRHCSNTLAFLSTVQFRNVARGFTQKSGPKFFLNCILNTGRFIMMCKYLQVVRKRCSEFVFFNFGLSKRVFVSYAKSFFANKTKTNKYNTTVYLSIFRYTHPVRCFQTSKLHLRD